jgi:hypothetical protein
MLNGRMQLLLLLLLLSHIHCWLVSRDSILVSSFVELMCSCKEIMISCRLLQEARQRCYCCAAAFDVLGLEERRKAKEMGDEGRIGTGGRFEIWHFAGLAVER